MPMLGKKQFSLAKSLTDIQPGEEIYTILHTQEQFRSKDEYEKRLELYNQEIWTCQCTGHTTLTHEEAWKSEKAAFKMLKAQFPECFEKPVLQIVHHSTDSLDSLNDQAWLKLHQVLAVGETVTFKVNSCSKTLKGTIVGISPTEAGGSSNCNSPSSDKENSSEEKDTSPKKWTPPKLLPYKYSVQLQDGPIINSVPVQDLTRCERPPSKDLVRLFIRSFAVRSGNYSTSPWVVREDLVKKYALPSKFADFLISPSKMAEAAKRAEEVSKKRKRQSQDGVASKKPKLADSDKKKKKPKPKDKLTPVSLNKKVKSPGKANKTADSDNQKKVKRGNTTPKKKSPKKKLDVIEVDESSDDEVSLAKIKMKCVSQGDNSDSDIPLSSLADQQTPKKKKLSLGAKSVSPNKKKKSDTPKSKKSGNQKSPGTPKTKKTPEKNKKTPKKRKRHDSSDSDVPLSKLTSPSKTPGTPKSKKASPTKGTKEKNEQTLKKKAKTPEKSGEKRCRGRPRKGEEKSSGKPGSKKGMKQMTLLDLAKKDDGKSPVHTPKKSPPKTPATPLIVKKLLQLNKAEDKVKFSMMLKKACMILTPTQRKNLPSPLKEKVQRRIELMEEKKALEKMSESEREAYLKEKKEKQKMKMKEKLNAKMKEMRQRYEDQDLDLQPLPPPKLVATPENLPNELFGDVAMVTEFISSYSSLLMPESEYPIYTDALMKALAGGPQGFAYMSRVLSTLLQTLLQDEIAEGYRELSVNLRDIAVNPYTVSELVRLCMRNLDAEDNGSDSCETEDLEVPDHLVQQLETQEFFQLDCQEKLALLRGLCLRILATYSVQDYMEEKQREAIQLTRQRNTEMKGYHEKRKEKKQQKMEEKDKTASTNTSINGDASSQDNSPAVTITMFYGKKPEDSSANDSAADSQGEDGDLVSVVKRRRLLAARAAAEKEKRDLERRLQREKEYQEERERREREQFETKYKDSILLARTVLRHSPIGYDRYHNRYWMFTNTTPGLYLEKGWVVQEISYNPGGVPDDSNDASTSTAFSTPTSSPTKASRLNLKRKKALVESTIPHSGQNLWFTYSSPKDLDALLKALHPQGIRESALKSELKKRYADITKAIQAAQRNNLELRDSDGHVEMVAGFKRELADIELRLRNGGLGGVHDYTAWEAKLMSAEDIPTMASCMLEMQENIMDKFLQGFMKLPKKADEADLKEEEEHGEDADEDAHNSKEDRKLSAAERRLQQWKDAVENCQTLSRLHVLLSMIDSCIKWEKSAENAKCKICRKKGDDDRLLLCDECNQAFHMYCLRPPLVSVPRGDWFCPACVPQSKRRSQAPRRFADESESESESEEEPMERNTTCEGCECEAGEDEDEHLIPCHKCPAVYHLMCHQPPLRRMPRGLWECNNCRNGITRCNKKRPQRKVATRKNYRYDSAEDSEPMPQISSHSSSSRRSGRTSAGETTSRSTRSSYKFEDFSHHRSRRAPSDLSICEDILQRLMKHSSSWPFLEPVDKKEVPDYYQIIKKPMDFQTMLKKCGRLSYSSPQEFVEDAILVFSNAATYNEPNSEVYNCMREVEKLFGELLTKHLPSYASSQLLLQDDGDASARMRRTRRN